MILLGSETFLLTLLSFLHGYIFFALTKAISPLILDIYVRYQRLVIDHRSYLLYLVKIPILIKNLNY